MIYQLDNELDYNRLKEKIKYFVEKQKTIEVKEVRAVRSLSQNSYFYLIVSWFAIEYGETADYVKNEIIKKQVCKSIFKTEFVNKKTGEIREAYKSTSELDTKEFTIVIEMFRNYSSKEAGIYLPEPSDMAFINEIKREITKNNKYL
jgi:hypothetical protein